MWCCFWILKLHAAPSVDAEFSMVEPMSATYKLHIIPNFIFRKNFETMFLQFQCSVLLEVSLPCYALIASFIGMLVCAIDHLFTNSRTIFFRTILHTHVILEDHLEKKDLVISGWPCFHVCTYLTHSWPNFQLISKIYYSFL